MVIFGLVAGAVEGLCLRHQLTVAAFALLAGISVAGLAMPLFFVGRFPGESADTPTGSAEFEAALIGWTVFVVPALVAAVGLSFGRPDPAAKPPQPPLQGSQSSGGVAGPGGTATLRSTEDPSPSSRLGTTTQR